MTVPTWTAIPDSMVAPRAPVTSDLLTRLRNQWAAILGVDPTSVTMPAFSLPQSMIATVESGLFVGDGTSSTVTTAEYRVSRIAAPLETNIQQGVAAHVGIYPSGGSPAAGRLFLIIGIDLHYTAGAVDGVTISSKKVYDTGPLIDGPPTHADANVFAADNSWYTFLNTSSGVPVKVKCRATTTDVYLQFQVTNGNGGAAIGFVNFVNVRKELAAKA